MKYRLAHINVRSVALYSFIFYLILSLLALMPLFGLAALFGMLVPADFFTYGLGIDSLGYLSFFVLLSLIFAQVILGTLLNILLVLLYNVLSMRMGGIKIMLQKNDSEPFNAEI